MKSFLAKDDICDGLTSKLTGTYAYNIKNLGGFVICQKGPYLGQVYFISDRPKPLTSIQLKNLTLSSFTPVFINFNGLDLYSKFFEAQEKVVKIAISFSKFSFYIFDENVDDNCKDISLYLPSKNLLT